MSFARELASSTEWDAGEGAPPAPCLGGEAQLRCPPKQSTHRCRSSMLLCNAAAAPLQSQPTGLRFADRLDVVTQEERPPHHELNM